MGAADTVLLFGEFAVSGGHHYFAEFSQRRCGPPEDDDREGWRLWYAGPDGQLYAPFYVNVPLVPVPVRLGGVVTATCPLQAPGHSLISCTCGIRYVPDARDFEALLGYMKAGARHLLPGWRLVAAHGIGEGARDFDVTGTAGQYWLARAYRRCERFRITDLSYA